MEDYRDEISISFVGMELEHSVICLLERILEAYASYGFIVPREELNYVECYIFDTYVYARRSVLIVNDDFDEVSLLRRRFCGVARDRMSRESFIRIGRCYDELVDFYLQIVSCLVNNYVAEIDNKIVEPQLEVGEILGDSMCRIVGEVVEGVKSIGMDFSATSLTQAQFESQVAFVAGVRVCTNDDNAAYNCLDSSCKPIRLEKFNNPSKSLLFELIYLNLKGSIKHEYRLCSKQSYNLFCDWLKEEQVRRYNRKRDVRLKYSGYVIDKPCLTGGIRDSFLSCSLICSHKEFECDQCGSIGFEQFLKRLKTLICKKISNVLAKPIHREDFQSFPQFCAEMWRISSDYFNYNYWGEDKEIIKLLKYYSEFYYSCSKYCKKAQDYVCYNWLIGRRNKYLRDWVLSLIERKVFRIQCRSRAHKS